MVANRITQHLAAISLPSEITKQPKREPDKRQPCYGVCTYNPHEIKGGVWCPKGVEDDCAEFEVSNPEWQGKYLDIRDAIAWAREYNVKPWAFHKEQILVPDTWAGVAYFDGPGEEAGFQHHRSCTPLKYYVAGCCPSKTWEPPTLCSVPPGFWCDEGVRIQSLRRYESAYDAVVDARQDNRKWRRKVEDCFGTWNVAVAVEFEPFAGSSVFTFEGGKRSGIFTTGSQHRMHIVDSRWPGVREAAGGVA